MTGDEITAWRNLAIIPVIVGALQALCIIRCREWVKTDLRERLCQALAVRWRPFSFRANRLKVVFGVIYSDWRGQRHRATCWTYWHRPSITWYHDEIVGAADETWAGRE